MPVLEVFTIGGGEYLVNVFNAVAAWTNLGGYKGLIQVVLVMGLIMALLILSFTNDWRAWLNWFLQATGIYLCLMVPRVDVLITDRINPGLAGAAVANVPLGLGVMASFTSQIGDYLVQGAELVFGLPGDLNYSRNGMIYGSRLFQATQTLRINDPEFSANLDEHMRQCVFYDVLLGLKSMDALAKADDLWAALGPGSPARSQKWLERQPGGTVTSTIVTCRGAYTLLDAQWAGLTDALGGVFGKQLYPKQSEALARAKLFTDLPIAYQYLTGTAKAASDIMKQTLMINAFGQAMHSMAGSSGAASVDVYATTRAEIQTENTYRSIAHSAMKWVPILNIVLTVVFYALFPVIFPLFLMPKTGVLALKGYVTGFFYLAAWGPLYVILHMVMMFKSAEDVAAAGVGGLTLASFTGINAVNDDIGVLAGYLVGSIPFIAAGLAKGALAISTQATSYLAPSQAASEEAAREATTGNISFGNLSYDNFTYNMRQGNGWTTAGVFTGGATQTNFRTDDGTVVSSFGDSMVVDSRGAISSLSYTPQLTKAINGELSEVALQSKARTESLANAASTTFTMANAQAAEFRRMTSAGSSFERSLGADDRDSVTTTSAMLEQAVDNLVQRQGLERSVAENLVNEMFFNGTLSSDVGARIGAGSDGAGLGAGGGAGLRGSTGVGGRTGTSLTAGASTNLSAAKDYLENVSRTQNWSDARETYLRLAQSSRSENLRSLAESMTATYTEANAVAREAREAFDETQRLEQAASLRESQNFSVAQNLSQEFVEFVLAEQAKNRDLWAPVWNPTRGEASTPGEIAERDLYIARFAEMKAQQIRDGIEPELVAPTPADLVGPSANTQSRVKSLSDDAMDDVRNMQVGTVPGGDLVQQRRAEREEAVEAGAEYVQKRLDRREEALEEPTSNLSSNPRETLDRVKEEVGEPGLRGLWEHLSRRSR